jgi:hypothetical protein
VNSEYFSSEDLLYWKGKNEVKLHWTGREEAEAVLFYKTVMDLSNP